MSFLTASRRRYAAALLIAATAIGCGYSEEEMQVKRDRIDQLTRALDKLEQDHGTLQDRFKVTASENAELGERLGPLPRASGRARGSLAQRNGR
jgi:hypothetical protein